ncbi:uncharacterized protein LOC125295944 [Alosa alosa]|uniref:uncharacterized protein LOC125295944 n=1 Tax=Alosa alosa TaxID=278164 RepID=UPI002015153B|nr:uncharacterized protein LOC125295944 [Alosa alosa]
MKFALVSWSKGNDKGALSIVPINWVIEFDPENTEKEYLVECRSIDKESTLKVAERNLLEENQPKGKKRKRLPNKLYLNTQEETVVAKKKLNYKQMAARRSELEILSQDEPNLSPVDATSEELEDEIRALGAEIQRLRDQQKAGSSTDLETQVKALTKENTRLRKMAIKEIPSVLSAVKTLIADKMTESSSYEGDGESECETRVALACALLFDCPSGLFCCCTYYFFFLLKDGPGDVPGDRNASQAPESIKERAQARSDQMSSG